MIYGPWFAFAFFVTTYVITRQPVFAYSAIAAAVFSIIWTAVAAYRRRQR